MSIESKNNPNARAKAKIVVVGSCGCPVQRVLVQPGHKLEWRCEKHGTVSKLRVEGVVR